MDYRSDLTTWRRDYLLTALAETGYDVAATAALVGLPRRTLYQYLSDLEIDATAARIASRSAKSAESCTGAES
jgi:DNA-binding NtrC family response regulator